MIPSFADVQQAAERICGQIHRTPVFRCRQLDALAGAELFFKCENFQKVGAFKFRGASNAVRALSPEVAARGVVTHSSGNHAAALALAAKCRGIRAEIVMPSDAPRVKQAAVAGYGAQIRLCEPTLAAREALLGQVVAETGAHFVHPYDDPHVIAGQGTAALELVEEVGALDLVLAPVGGGGLLSGTSLAVRSLLPGARVVGVEPEIAADAEISFRTGVLTPSTNAKTVADGLRTALSARTMAIIRQNVDQIVLVSEASILEAMALLWSRAKLVVEPSGAVPLAALLERRVKGQKVGIILSGGNVELPV